MLNVGSGIFRFSRLVAAVVRCKVPKRSRDFMNTGTFEWEAVASSPKDCDLAWQNRLVVGRTRDVSALPAFSSGPDQTNTFEKK